MSPRSLKYGILLLLTLFCVSELGRFRPLLVKSPGDVTAAKELKEGGGKEKSAIGFALCSSATFELTDGAGFAEAQEMASCAPQLYLMNQHLRGPPQLATL